MCKLRSSLHIHAFHHTDQIDPDIHVLDSECWQQKHTQHAPSTKTECHNLYGWIKQMVTYAKILPKMVNPRDISGNAEEEGSGFGIGLVAVPCFYQVYYYLLPCTWLGYWPPDSSLLLVCGSEFRFVCHLATSRPRNRHTGSGTGYTRSERSSH